MLVKITLCNELLDQFSLKWAGIRFLLFPYVMLSIRWWITRVSSYLPSQCHARIVTAFLFAGPLQRQSTLTGVSFLIYEGCLIEAFFFIQGEFAILTFRFICFQNLLWVTVWILMTICPYYLCDLGQAVSPPWVFRFLIFEMKGLTQVAVCPNSVDLKVLRKRIREILGSTKSGFLPFQWELLLYSVCFCPSP